MNTHIRTVAILHIAFGALSLIGAIVVFMALSMAGGIVVTQGEHEAAGILGIIAIFISALLSILAVPELLAGFALLNERPWGRPLAIALSCFNLLNLPFGTALGIYTLWALLREQ